MTVPRIQTTSALSLYDWPAPRGVKLERNELPTGASAHHSRWPGPWVPLVVAESDDTSGPYLKASAALFDAMTLLRYRREEQGLSVRKLAEEMDVAASVVGEMESGSRWPRLRTLGLYADVVDCRFTIVLGHKYRRALPPPREAVRLVKLEASLTSRDDRLACWRDVLGWSLWWLRRHERTSLVDAVSMSGLRLETHSWLEQAAKRNIWPRTSTMLACVHSVAGEFQVQPREEPWALPWSSAESGLGGGET